MRPPDKEALTRFLNKRYKWRVSGYRRFSDGRLRVYRLPANYGLNYVDLSPHTVTWCFDQINNAGKQQLLAYKTLRRRK